MKKPITFLFLIITLASVFAHFWNYKDMAGFTLDAPIHLTAVKEMVDSGKISLVGPSVTSKETFGRMIFTGPFYYYVLAAAGILTGWNVIFISGFLTGLWLISFGILFFWLNKKFGGVIAILVYSILSFYPFFIQFSRQITNPQLIPVLGTLFFISLVERKKGIHYLLSGIFWGLGLNVHYSTILWVFIAGFFMLNEIYHKKFRLINWLILVLGIVLAEIPFIIFELRHNFYNLNTVIFHYKYGNFSQGYTFNIWYYYALPFLTPAAYLLGKFLHNIRKTKVYSAAIVILSVLAVYFALSAFGTQGQKMTHFPGWSIDTQKRVANIIIKDNEKDFEVAETISSDTRAMDIRWWLREANVPVMDVVSYKTSPVLYLVTTGDRPPETETVWEVSSLRPFNIEFKNDIGGGLYLYKLVRK